MSHDDFKIPRRKALAALGTIGVASAGAGLGTSAYFSDQETFENNRLVAGTLDLGVAYSAHYSDWSADEGEGVDVVMYDGGPDEVGDADALAAQAPDGYTGLPANDAWLIAVDDPGQFLANTQYDSYNDAEGDLVCTEIGGASSQADGAPRPVIDLEDVKPGDFGEITFDFLLCDNPGYVWLEGTLQNASENGVTEPEADDPDEESGVVELLDVVRAAVWIDDGNNYQNGDEEPFALGSLREILGMVSGSNGTALNSGSDAEQYGGTGEQGCFAGGERHSLAFAWWVPVDHGNEIQSDSATFDLGFYTEQCRHNAGGRFSTFEVSDLLIQSEQGGTDLTEAAEGTTIYVAANVTNNGGETDTQRISFDVLDEEGAVTVSEVDFSNQQRDPGASSYVSFNWTVDVPPGDYTLAIRSEDDSVRRGFTVT
jgi:predicted ribosomally synthesized peptide with SipW-like signal peptide